MVSMFEESEIKARILEHLAARPGLPDVAQFWHAYVVALGEAGLISIHASDRLVDLLPPHDATVIVEAMCGEEYFAEHPTRKTTTHGAVSARR